MNDDAPAGRLIGKRTVVTGAAGGIGGAAARAFAAEGATVGLVDRPGAALDALADELAEAGTALPTDVTDEESVRSALTQWREQRGGLDVVYLCAGVELIGRDDIAHQTSLAVWQQTYAVNATGVFLTLKYALPALIDAGGGSVIVCGSPTGLTMCGAGEIAYSSSKAAAMAMVRTVAADYARFGIRANTIVPGTTDTPLTASLLADPAIREQLTAGTPLGRIGTPADLVGIAVFLASDESAYATAGEFTVDGGLCHR